MNWDKYPNFSRSEMVCSCGCGRADMEPEFMRRLQRLRSHYNRPMVITSGYRCPDYNARVGTTGRDGPHTTGKAVDVAVRGADARDLASMAMTYGFTGIGVQQKGEGRFLHLDLLPVNDPGSDPDDPDNDDYDPDQPPRPWLWSY